MRKLVILPLLGLLPAILATPVAAHVHLVGADPEDGAHLDEPPTEIVLAFDGALGEGGTVTVTGPDGVDVDTTEPVIDEERAEVAAAGDWAPGEYIVTFDLLAGDGHEAVGEVTFTLTDAVTGSEPTQEPTEESQPTQEPTEEPQPTEGPQPTERVAADEPDGAEEGELAVATAEDNGEGIWPVVVAVVVICGILAAAASVMGKRRANDR